MFQLTSKNEWNEWTRQPHEISDKILMEQITSHLELSLSVMLSLRRKTHFRITLSQIFGIFTHSRLSLFCNYKVLKMVSKSLGNSPNSSKNSMATLNQLKNVVQTDSRHGAVFYVSQVGPLICTVISMALLQRPSYVCWEIKKFIRKLPKICNIQFRIFAKKCLPLPISPCSSYLDGSWRV